MEKKIRISGLAIGERARITGYEKEAAAYRGRILSMGLTRGTEFTLTKKAPMGNPVEIEVMGYKLSLRKEEADVVRIEKIEPEDIK